MREPKPMKRTETAEEIRRREKRLNRREKTIHASQKRREYRLERKEKNAALIDAIEQTLMEDRRKTAPPDKKLSAGTLLEAFSFIGWTPFDKRDQIPQRFKPRSFNENRQYIDFFRTFVYPYPVPLPVLFTTRLKESCIGERGERVKTPSYDIIVLSKKWVCDIVSGDSFYRRNKEYFTRAEAYCFLNTPVPYTGASSVLELYFQAKCKARNIAVKLRRIIAKVFTLKFEKTFNHEIIIGFLDLLGRSENYQIDEGELGDICDFILAKIRAHLKGRGMVPPFSFSGRTMTSIISLTNEWHAEVQREQEAMNLLAQAEQGRQPQNRPNKPTLAARWTGINVPLFKHEADGCVWTVTQLLTAQDLLNEGRKMKNCVSTYAYKCSGGECSIFNVSCFYTDSQLTESKATLEVSRDRSLVQAKGKCNIRVNSVIMNVIIRWAQANRIRNKVT
ncbi:hypothetical protein FACS189442_0280 [Spirochaetia bacterium]|nr:hypothetical protein FACS189442_0280 [Spirochaetia bacterium]